MPEALKIAEKLSTLGNNRIAYQGIKMSLYRTEILQSEASEKDIYAYMAMKKFRQSL